MTASNKTFFGVTLNDINRSVTWDFSEETDLRCHKLVIKQIMLDAEARYDEYNVVEVNSSIDFVKIPIAVLKADEQRTTNPGVEFYESKVTFCLIRGSGPVHMHGYVVRDDVDVIFVSEDGQRI
ncbi:hypothetical protein ACLKA6_013037 [Drosophila palustris]